MIESFLEYTEGIPSPEIFRLWAGIGLVAAVLERRVYVTSARTRIYPNLFTLLVSPPGVGKSQAITATRELWRKVPDLIVSPDNMTKAALVDSLAKAARKIVRSPTELLEFNSMTIAADELGVFMSSYDNDFLSTLNKLYDNPHEYREMRRMFKEELYIPEPQLNILAGTQPRFMSEIFPEHAWGMGFTSRLLMIYSSNPVKVSLFNGKLLDKNLYGRIVKDLKAIMGLFGEFAWTDTARAEIELWNATGQKKTEPTHTKLEHYIPRRIMHLLKLCMVSSVSHGNSMLITELDFHQALTWLLAAEKSMPDVFRNMAQKSDAETISELHQYAWSLYSKDKKPIHEGRLIHFLQTRVPADRVMRVLEIAERSRFLDRMAGTELYKPVLLNKTGIE